MTDLLHEVELPSDAELISRVRGGDVAAYGQLFTRHKDAAHRLARQLVRGPDSDDLVAEAFAKVLTVLQGGGGPDVAFRAYLLTAVRRLHVDRVRAGQRLHTTDDLTPFDPGVPFQDTAVAGFENGAAAKAFASLPERWQLVLWHLEVEGQKPADIAPLLGMSPNSVSALAYRAREGLRQAFLTMHLADITEADCRWVNEHLGAFVRKGLAKRDAGKVRAHLDGCRRCTAMYLELDDVNSNLAAVIAPLLLGTAAAGYLASSGIGAAGVLGALSRLKGLAGAHAGAATAAGVTAGVAAVAVVAVAISHGGGHRTPEQVADRPAAVATSSAAGGAPAPSPGSPTSGSATTASSPRPSPTPSPTLSATPSPTPTPTPSGQPSSSTSPSAPVSAATPAASTSPSAPVLTAPPSDQPSGQPSDPPSDPPTQPQDPVVGDPVVEDPAVNADGSVSVTVRNARVGDSLDLAITSQETTFADTLEQPGCSLVDSRHARCETAVPLLRGGRTAAVVPAGDVTLTLPLAFPDYMVSDDVEVTATLGGTSVRTRTQSFRPSRTPVFDFPAPVLTGPVQSLDGEEDRYDVRTTAVLPRRVTGLRYRVDDPDGRVRFRDVAGPCTLDDDATTMTCPAVRDGDPVDLPLVATGLRGPARVAVTVAPVDDFSDPTAQTSGLTLSPGTHLVLAPRSLPAQHQDHGAYDLSTTVSGVRAGLRTVRFGVSDGLAVVGSRTAGCEVEGAVLRCNDLADGAGVSVRVRAEPGPTPVRATLTATPGDGFTELSEENTAVASLVPSHDFALETLALQGQRLAGDGDEYDLVGTLGTLPADVRELTFEATSGGVFATDQAPGCTRVDDAHVTCGTESRGAVSLRLRSTGTREHDATVGLVVPAGYDDPDGDDPTDNAATVTGLRPGVDLHLSALDPDNESPSNDDDRHLVRTRLDGVRAGLGGVRYTLSGAATITSVDDRGCTVSEGTVTCAPAADGPRTFTVVSTDVHARTQIRITVEPVDPFVEVDEPDNSAGAWLAPRPTYDFGIGPLTMTRHTVTGGTDHLVLTGVVRAVPKGVGGVTLQLDGGTFADAQDTGCARVDDTHVRCTDLDTERTIGLRVESTASVVHDLTLRLQPPRGYDDPDPSDDATSLTVEPGVDLALGPLTPADPVPAGGAYQVAGVVHGVRSGPVTFTVSGAARLTASGCTPAGAAAVTCAGLTEGRLVRFSLVPDRPSARTTVTVTAHAAAPFVEVDDADNAATATLAPDVVLESVQVTGHREADREALVRVQVAGVPAGVDTVRIRLSGEGVGAGAGQVHLTDGASGADGEAGVSCHTSDANGGTLSDGVYATCTGVRSVSDGRFYVDLRLAHPHGTSRRVTFTVLPVGVDQGSHVGNDSRDATIG